MHYYTGHMKNKNIVPFIFNLGIARPEVCLFSFVIYVGTCMTISVVCLRYKQVNELLTNALRPISEQVQNT